VQVPRPQTIECILACQVLHKYASLTHKRHISRRTGLLEITFERVTKSQNTIRIGSRRYLDDVTPLSNELSVDKNESHEA